MKQNQNKSGSEGNFTSNPRSIGEDIVDSLHNMGEELSNPNAPALTKAMRERASQAAKRSLSVNYEDLNSNISGMEAKAEDLGMYYEETGQDPEVGQAIDKIRDEHHAALVDKLNRPPNIPNV